MLTTVIERAGRRYQLLGALGLCSHLRRPATVLARRGAPDLGTVALLLAAFVGYSAVGARPAKWARSTPARAVPLRAVVHGVLGCAVFGAVVVKLVAVQPTALPLRSCRSQARSSHPPARRRARPQRPGTSPPAGWPATAALIAGLATPGGPGSPGAPPPACSRGHRPEPSSGRVVADDGRARTPSRRRCAGPGRSGEVSGLSGYGQGRAEAAGRHRVARVAARPRVAQPTPARSRTYAGAVGRVEL